MDLSRALFHLRRQILRFPDLHNLGVVAWARCQMEYPVPQYFFAHLGNVGLDLEEGEGGRV